jgi:hypothetical protein
MTRHRLHVHATALVWNPDCLDKLEEAARILKISMPHCVTIWLEQCDTLARIRREQQQ